ncbi:MAG: hypothetical protein RL033_7363 [Pseudomonadota bacterium]
MRAELRVRELLEALRAANLYRAPEQALEGGGEPGDDGSSVLDTRSNDYLGLASGLASAVFASPLSAEVGGEGEGEPKPEELRGPGSDGAVSRETPAAAGERCARVGAGASRLVSGTTFEHEALERELAQWLDVDACLLFSSAYAANVGALSALALQGDAVFSDELNHASIIDGCRLSRAETVVIPHRDLPALAEALSRPRPERSVRWVVTESYFSMDGTSPDFAALRALCDRHEAALVVDETHSLGVFGPEGRGLVAAAGVRADLLVGGLGKAFGLQGGFIAGSRSLQQWLWNRARSFVFSTGLSPWLCDRGRLHLQEVRGAEGARRRLVTLGMQLERALAAANIPLPPGRHGPLFPIVFGTEGAALAAAERLQQLGVRAQPIRPPTVPRGTARLRVSLRADMTEADVDQLSSALLDAWQRRGATEPVNAGELPSLEHLEAIEHAPTSTSLPRSFFPPPGDLAQRRWVVLGTGTGVGKSYVAEALLRSLAAAGHSVAGLKPIETGCRTSADGQPREGDAALLEAASQHVKHPRPHPLYSFREPIAPSLAAHREGQQIDIDAVASWVDRARCQMHGLPTLVIETAGGVFSPLSETATNFDLARTLGAARWLLVAPDRLGVLHDVTSTLRAMAALGRSPDLLLLSAPAEPDASTGTNAAELRRLGLTMPLLELGRDQPQALLALLDAPVVTAAE